MTSLFANLFFSRANMMESEKNSPGVAMKYKIHLYMERSRRTQMPHGRYGPSLLKVAAIRLSRDAIF
jgi:hypothetical protein